MKNLNQLADDTGNPTTISVWRKFETHIIELQNHRIIGVDDLREVPSKSNPYAKSKFPTVGGAGKCLGRS